MAQAGGMGGIGEGEPECSFLWELQETISFAAKITGETWIAAMLNYSCFLSW